MEPDRVLEVAVRAARAGAEVLRSGRGRDRVAVKSSFADLVSDADRGSEQAIREVIRAAFPDHAILGEESADRGLWRALAEDPAAVEHVWIVDPLDGTLNYVHGVPLYGVSVAYAHRGEVRVGVVLDVPRDAAFAAVAGRGATLDGRPLRVSGRARLEECLLATGFYFDPAVGARENLDHFCALQQRARGVRALGSAALALAYVAAGWLDGFWELRLAPWDVAAGALLVREAGGRVTHADGRPHGFARRDVVASNGHVHDALLAELGVPQRA